jgi:hypothetical protein
METGGSGHCSSRKTKQMLFWQITMDAIQA